MLVCMTAGGVVDDGVGVDVEVMHVIHVESIQVVQQQLVMPWIRAKSTVQHHVDMTGPMRSEDCRGM